MNVLISNDDGIRAEGIARLAAAALPFGRVYVAALEGVMNGIPAIAFSAREFCDPGAMEVYLPRVLQELLQALPKPGTLWNVNFPDCAASACKGILRGRVPAACSFYDNEYDRAEGALSIRVSNRGPEQCREGSDIHAILHGYVSIGEVRSPLF